MSITKDRTGLIVDKNSNMDSGMERIKVVCSMILNSLATMNKERMVVMKVINLKIKGSILINQSHSI